jgi:hypothetical protein
MNDRYHHVHGELQRAKQQHEYERQMFDQSAQDIREELEKERRSYDELKKQFSEIQECHFKHEEDLATSKAHAEDINKYCVEVAKQAESLIDQYKARMEGVEVKDQYGGQSIGAMILESAKNKHLVDTMCGTYSEEDTVMKLKFVSDQNIGLQLQVQALTQEVADLAQESADLRKALELSTEDRQSKKKTRRSQVSIEAE